MISFLTEKARVKYIVVTIFCLFLANFIFLTDARAQITCGDMDGILGVDIGDLVWMVDFQFLEGPEPMPDLCVSDIDNVLGVDIGDIVWMVDYQFLSGPPLYTNCCPDCFPGETQPCYTGPPETRITGECADGIQNCIDGEWGPCVGEVLPTAEVCDGHDNDCNGVIDDDAVDATIWYYDNDVDGYGDPEHTVTACSPPVGYTSMGGDCDDSNGGINPGATEIPDDEIDQDCNGFDAITCMMDFDNDDYGSEFVQIINPNGTCNETGYSYDNTDCNDNNASINPGATEIPDDGIDQDCNGFDMVSCMIDNDGDGWGVGLIYNPNGTCNQPGYTNVHYPEDCDDYNTSLNHDDADTDGYSTCDGDCDDANPSIHPGATEICDGIDNNCSGTPDDGSPAVMCPPEPYVSSTSCIAGECQITSCYAGYADCNGNFNDGCEVNLNNGSNCYSYTNGGSMGGDGCGDSYNTYYSRGEIVFRIHFTEECTGLFTSDDFNVRIRLYVPSGVNYDLYVYNDNCSHAASSFLPGNATEQVILTWNDVMLVDDSRYYRIEVRYHSGSSCNDWNLVVDSWGTKANPAPPPDGDEEPDEDLNESNDGIK